LAGSYFPDRALCPLCVVVRSPGAGIILQFARGDALPLFGLAEIPSHGHNLKKVHEILAHALVIFAAFHAAAALIRHLIFRDRTLVRMLPHSEK
jgi:cytochrome b561